MSCDSGEDWIFHDGQFFGCGVAYYHFRYPESDTVHEQKGYLPVKLEATTVICFRLARPRRDGSSISMDASRKPQLTAELHDKAMRISQPEQGGVHAASARL